MLRNVSYSALAIAMLASSPAAYAQDKGAGINNDEVDIVVTARKREERLIDVPVVMTAVSGEALASQGITNLDGISRVVPQLMIGPQGGSVQGGNVSIRGIAGPDSNPFGDQAVSFNVDGVQIAKSTVRRMADIDIAQVEVLKGPQALFFGKNSPAGIVSIRTADPGNSFEAGLKAGYEFEAREKRLEGFVSTPITDTLGFRFAGLFSDMSGYVKDLTPETAPFNYQPKHGRNPNKRDFAVRGTLLFTPAPAFSARLKVNYAETKTNGPAALTAFTSCPNGFRATGSGIDQCKASDGANSNATNGPVVGTIPGTLNSFGDGEPFQKQTQFLSSLELNYDLSDTVRLTSVTGYYDVKLRQCQNYENDPSFILPSCNPYQGHEFSQELRVATDLDGIFNFIGGVYYAKTNYKTGSITYLFGGNFDLLGPGFGGPTSPAQVNNYYLEQKGSAWSAYGQISLKPVEQLEITVGGRYSHEKKRLPLVQSGGGLGETYPIAGLGTPILDDSTIITTLLKDNDSWKDFSPEITVSYRPSPSLTVFGSYKQGFLSGGFNSSSVSFNAANPIVTNPDGSTRPRLPEEFLDISFDPQTIEGYEVGTKAALADNRLFLNFAAYIYKVDDLQVSNFVNATASIRNAGAVKIKGVEADFTYRTPIDGLTIRGAAAYNKGKYTSFPNAPCYNGQTVQMGCVIGADGNPSQDLKGRELVRAPKWNLSTSFDYETPVGGAFKLGLTGGLTYSSSYLTDASADPLGRQGSYTLLDGSIRLATEDDRWEIALIGKNLTNKWIYYASANVPFTGGASGLSDTLPGGAPNPAAGILGDRFSSLGRGREIMLRLGFKY